MLNRQWPASVVKLPGWPGKDPISPFLVQRTLIYLPSSYIFMLKVHDERPVLLGIHELLWNPLLLF